ncbi:Histidine phosphatase family protein [Rhodovastum atsumiense]|uniref:Histidine phosphatase family protein n=1 Tax=Rhodovastum atsumiense TaxID=504468 RepID=A0A5M6IU31_9PROT|nr:histidine phosphatase family protein [Rhodovastum atsumiense]KAA5611038.1 histidine phosphatase family protein [Rhodovastum atsumiense]CAH2600175.1 Histidine phosphatase family protein [Rhodovastum atsumiense]
MQTLVPRAFWFLRHGETDWNAQGLSQGNVDIPLNANGIAQARAAAQVLRNRGIATVMASPLSRARATAEIVAEALGLPVTFDPELKEVSFGVQEGQSMGTWFDDWVEGRFTPEGAESFPALRARGVAAANRALARPAPVLIVSHGALFRALRAEMGLPAHVRTPNGIPFLCEPGSPWVLSPVSTPAG